MFFKNLKKGAQNTAKFVGSVLYLTKKVFMF